MQIPLLTGIFTDNQADFRANYPRNMIPIALDQGISTGYLRPADGIIALNVTEDFAIIARDGSQIIARNGDEIFARSFDNGLGIGPGINRGGILWEGEIYRVMGTEFVSIAQDGTVTTIGTIPGTNRVTMTYSFDKLAIVAEPDAYLYDGSTLTQITDPDLGSVKDGIWIDGYFMFIDDEFIIISELTDPFAIDPLKYGSSRGRPRSAEVIGEDPQ
jgi:Phage stabilisation protein.